jgi:AraC-like DNA-binding protein
LLLALWADWCKLFIKSGPFPSSGIVKIQDFERLPDLKRNHKGMNPAVFTKAVLPHRALEPYIRCYAIRSFDTNDGIFSKALIADNETVLNFFLKGKLHGFEDFDSSRYSYNEHNEVQSYFSGLQTSTKGLILLKGMTVILTVHFKPTGFYELFDIGAKEVRETYGEMTAFIGNETKYLSGQMVESGSIEKSVSLLQAYLLRKLLSRKQRYRHLAIKSAANLLVEYRGVYSIKTLASNCNMTIQTLETQFANQVGVDPKTFCRLTRLKNAINLKLYAPSMTWTNIAHTLGFYDQMHLIKDFKDFTSLSPNKFIAIINPPTEEYIG